ncbi:MAG: phage tail assembly protein [Eubacterium sp.]|jgi:hypothetical protein|nr:phage tail assembly protein [Eubacterium sp.]
MFQEAYRFTLPYGIKHNGVYMKEGEMRLATAGDEIRAASHPKARQNTEYIGIALISMVITIDGYPGPITPELIEGLILADYTFLQNMYTTINEPEEMKMRVTCVKCGEIFYESVNFMNPV